MRRGKITSGSASTARQRQARRRRPAGAPPAAPAPSARARRAGAPARRREARAHAARSRRRSRRAPKAASCTSPVASRSSSCTLGCAARKLRSHCGSEREADGRDEGQAQPPEPRRRPRPAPRAGSAAARAPAARAACGSSAAPAAVSSTLRWVRSNRRTPSPRSSCAMRLGQRRLRHVQRCAARPKCSSSATATNWRHRRSSITGSLICRAYQWPAWKMYWKESRAAAILPAPSRSAPDRHGQRRPSPSAAAQRQHHRGQGARAQPLHVLRHGLQGDRLRQADGRRGQRPQHHHALQQRPAEAGRRGGRRPSRRPAATRRSSARRPSPTAWRWAPRA